MGSSDFDRTAVANLALLRDTNALVVSHMEWSAVEGILEGLKDSYTRYLAENVLF